MKKILTTLLLAICISTIAKSQTTETEYNYITKGLIDDMNKGKDIKVGYKLVRITDQAKVDYTDKNWRGITVYYFQKTETSKNQAFVLECKSKNGDKRYMCLPTSNASSDLWQKAFNEFDKAGTEWHFVFFWAMAKLSTAKLL